MHKKMFDGMQPEQFYQFLAAATTTSTPITPHHHHHHHHHNTNNNTSSLPLSFSLHNYNHFPTYSSSSPPQSTFDPSSYHHLLHHHHQFHPRNTTNNNNDVTAIKTAVQTTNLHRIPSSELPNTNTCLQDDGVIIQRSSMLMPEIPWSNDEMLALFRIRSSIDNTWFPDFIWENVSRKLAELGFKRSAEKCKEKFEEETRSFNTSIIITNNNNKNNNNNYRLFGELEELCNNNNNNNNNNHNNIIDNNNIDGGDNDVDGNNRRQQPPLPPPPPPVADDEDGRLLETNEEGGEGDPNVEEDEDEDDDEDDNVGSGDHEEEQSMGDSEKTEEKNNTKKGVTRKRKRQKKFEMFKGFCEKIVNKMMAQQQQLHCKILQDMVKRDEEKIAKEEAWKRQEIERLEKELEFRVSEQAISGDRQSKILDFLNKFNSSSSVLDSHSLREALEKLDKVLPNVSSSNSSILSQGSIISAQLQPTSSSCTTTITHDHNNHNHNPNPNPNPLVSCSNNVPSSSSNENVGVLSHVSLGSSKLAPPIISSSTMDQASQIVNPNPNTPRKFSKSDHTSTNATDEINKTLESLSQDLTPVVGIGKDDTGRRWPRDEVLALINIRCSLFNNNNNGSGEPQNDKEAFSNKGPLWERISQKMMELGYKRSAKRCKEKWENINKYFRKTKDLNKKRSIDSRTCPYFHQLSHLYNQGALVGSTDRPMNLPGSPENQSSMPFPETQLGGSTNSNAVGNTTNDDVATNNNTMHASHQSGDEDVVQVPRFDFEF